MQTNDSRPSHRRVYAKGFYDGLQAAANQHMTPEKFKLALGHQSVIARKLFEAVPIQEAWSSSKIITALSRMGSTRVDMKTAEGCLNSLKDAGLIKEPERGLFQQVVPRDAVKLPALATGTVNITPSPITACEAVELADEADAAHDAGGAPNAPPSPAASLGDLAASLRLRANALIKLADEIDAEALRFEDQIAAANSKLDRFKALKALLTEV